MIVSLCVSGRTGAAADRCDRKQIDAGEFNNFTAEALLPAVCSNKTSEPAYGQVYLLYMTPNHKCIQQFVLGSKIDDLIITPSFIIESNKNH